MAASLLDVVDWDNLEGVDIPIAVSVLAQATQERFNIGTVDRDGGMSNTPGVNPSITLRDKFPYKSNTPIYTVNEGDPLIDFTDEVEELLREMIPLYADIEKWDDADTDSSTDTTLFNLGNDADAPGTYDNRLFEVTGYTSWPDLSVYAIEEVKKWYDMIVELKYIVRQSGLRNDDYVIYNGVFDVEADAFGTANQDGAEYFSNPQLVPVDTGIPIADTSVYDLFEPANVALFGTLPSQFDESTDTGTFPPLPFQGGSGIGSTVYDVRASRSVSTTYVSWIRAWETTYVTDWTDSVAAIGFIGKPLSYKNQIAARFSASSSVPSFTPVITYPESTTADLQRYYTSNVVTRVGEIDTIAVDQKLTPITVPTTLAAFTSNNQEVENNIVLFGSSNTLLFSDFQFLEDWDGDGGFEYYTP